MTKLRSIFLVAAAALLLWARPLVKPRCLALRLGVVRQPKAQSRRVRIAAQHTLLRTLQARQQHLEKELDLRNEVLLQATFAATEAKRARLDLLTRMGHDLRAPLTAIIGYADLVVHSDGRCRSSLSSMERSSRKMLALIDGFMDCIHGSVLTEPLKPQPIYLRAFLSEVAAQAATEAEKSGNRFDCRVATALPDVVEIDARRIRQVLEHLLENATKFTSGGQVEMLADIFPSVGASGDRHSLLVFTVRDTGPGMPQDQAATLFKPWQRLSSSPNSVCPGLGLVVTHQWVVRMGGHIEVMTVPGKGTEMRVIVPFKLSSEQAMLVPRLAGEEDNAATRSQLGECLERHGFILLLLPCGEDAVNRIEQPAEQVPDLIVTDLKMPGAESLRRSMTTIGKPHHRADFAVGLVWLNCLVAHAGNVGLGTVDAQDELLRATVEPALSGWWQSHLWVVMAAICCTLPFLYRLVRSLAAQEPALTKEQADLLAQARQEVEHLEELLQLRAEALQTAWLSAYEANRDRADLLGCVSSKLREQADQILDDAKMMLSSAAGDKGHESIILCSANRLCGLVEELISYAQTGKDAQGIQPYATRLDAWLEGLAAEAEVMAKINGNFLDFRLAGELASGIEVDRARLRQVLLELLHNAAKFTRNGRITFETEARRHFAGSLELVFTVQDTGKGIDPGSLQRVFEPYARSQYGGGCHGAGLAMARHTARLMNGELVAASEPGQGTIMRLTVPAKILADGHGPGFYFAPQGAMAKVDLDGVDISAITVPADAEMLAHLWDFVRMGAISDLIDWADGPAAKNAKWGHFVPAVADLARQGDLQALSVMLIDAGCGEHPAARCPEAMPVACPSLRQAELDSKECHR